MTPIYKGQGSHDDKNNYRPITVLPILSKLFEKHICDHLYDFLEENALRHHLQSRFLKFHSTETALIRLIDQLLFIDYRKAFDLKRSWSTSNETECLWDMWSRTRLTTQLFEWTQTIRSHWRMSFSPRTVTAGVSQESSTGPYYVSPVHQRPTLASLAFYRWHLCGWHHSQFLIRRDRWTSWHHISPSTRPRWPFAVVGCQQDGHKRRQDEMSRSN